MPTYLFFRKVTWGRRGWSLCSAASVGCCSWLERSSGELENIGLQSHLPFTFTSLTCPQRVLIPDIGGMSFPNWVKWEKAASKRTNVMTECISWCLWKVRLFSTKKRWQQSSHSSCYFLSVTFLRDCLKEVFQLIFLWQVNACQCFWVSTGRAKTMSCPLVQQFVFLKKASSCRQKVSLPYRIDPTHTHIHIHEANIYIYTYIYIWLITNQPGDSFGKK